MNKHVAALALVALLGTPLAGKGEAGAFSFRFQKVGKAALGKRKNAIKKPARRAPRRLLKHRKRIGARPRVIPRWGLSARRYWKKAARRPGGGRHFFRWGLKKPKRARARAKGRAKSFGFSFSKGLAKGLKLGRLAVPRAPKVAKSLAGTINGLRHRGAKLSGTARARLGGVMRRLQLIARRARWMGGRLLGPLKNQFQQLRQQANKIIGEEGSKAIIGEEGSKAIIGEEGSKAIIGEEGSKAIIGEEGAR